MVSIKGRFNNKVVGTVAVAIMTSWEEGNVRVQTWHDCGRAQLERTLTFFALPD